MPESHSEALCKHLQASLDYRLQGLRRDWMKDPAALRLASFSWLILMAITMPQLDRFNLLAQQMFFVLAVGVLVETQVRLGWDYLRLLGCGSPYFVLCVRDGS